MPENIYRKPGSKLWYFCVIIDKRKIRRSLQTTDRALAKKRARELLEKLNREHYGDQRHTWVDAISAWMEEVGDTLKPQTVRRYGTSISAVRHILEPLYVDEIDKAVLAKIAGRPKVANATRKRDLNAVSVVLQAAAARGWIENAPAYNTKRLRERAKPLVLPDVTEIRTFAASLSATLGRMVMILTATGMRLEEAGGLLWRDVDLRRRTITLHHTKANRTRVVPLSQEAVDTLKDTPRHLSCPHVFWHSQAAPRRYSDLSGLFYDYRKREDGGVPWRIHDLRHFFAVSYLRDGGSIYQLQKILGHSTIAVTERYLDHLTPDEQAVAKQTAS